MTRDLLPIGARCDFVHPNGRLCFMRVRRRGEQCLRHRDLPKELIVLRDPETGAVVEAT